MELVLNFRGAASKVRKEPNSKCSILVEFRLVDEQK